MVKKSMPIQGLMYDETGTLEVNEQLYSSYYSGFVDQFSEANSTLEEEKNEEL
ncbi:hypothetical protein PY093_12600 [Cytobacillus sp. S13-E01]|uniref:hypothetical protein n=1 Tax=Cytobacillus sp. S13-E01 TaxID=3031326 RepID=UPI0023D8555B|nr:hypothetical protein [Cytobacillus sp. S13-E01]MDF0727529.1 hypothetical protein [Cytobacillus sp. S13-E01]